MPKDRLRVVLLFGAETMIIQAGTTARRAAQR
jgi:hypothetical protein